MIGVYIQKLRDWLRPRGDESEVDDAEENRLVRRLLLALPEARGGAVQRLHLRLRAPNRQPSRLPVLLGALAVSIAALAVHYRGELPIEDSLVSEETWAVLEPTREVTLSFRGTGNIEGTRDEPRVSWTSGVLHVDVSPNQGVRLEVETREAVVRVIGTSFSVVRDALGTRVEVRHGLVSVTCTQSAPVHLGVGEETVCLPASPAGLLARARRLQRSGEPPTVVLEAIDLGLRAGGVGAVRSELLAARVEALVQAGEPDLAAAAAEALLSEGTHRRDELLRTLAGLKLIDSCADAFPYLMALAAEPTATDDDRIQLARCSAPN